MSLIRIFKVGIVILLLVILAIIVRYFIVRPLREHQIPIKTEKIDAQKIEKKQKAEHLEIKGKEKILLVKADKHYMGEDESYHAEGDVEMTLFKKREGKDVFLYGDKVVYDKDRTYFVSSGKAKAKFKDLVIESVLIHYDNKKELFWTESGVYFYSQRLKGPAQKMIYLMEEERLELKENIRLQIEPKIESSSSLVAEGENFEYSEKEKRGKMEGEVRLFHGKSRSSADSLEFELSQDGEHIRTLILKGEVKASLIEEEMKDISHQDRPSLFAQSARREAQAEEIKLMAFPKISKIHEIEASGNCSFKFISSSGSYTQIHAESVKYVFDNEGELIEFKAIKSARMINQGENPKERQLIEGDTLTIMDKTDILRVKGKSQFGARVTSPRSEIFAGEIAFFLDNGNLEVKEGVKVILKSKKEEEKPIGIFSKEHPVFIRANEMRYFDEGKRFLFNGNIKAWQEKRVLLADEIELFEETGEIFCTGEVKSVIPHKPKEEKEEERLEISSDRMTYKPEKNLVFYKDKCCIKVREAVLRAQSIFVYLKDEKGDVQRIIARGKVVIIQDLGEGRGEEAIYEPDKEVLVLLGNPVLIDKERGITKGDKLTFYMADGRIIAENKGKERSVTVIKRER